MLLQSGFTPLNYAAQNGHVLLVEKLIRLGAKVDGINKVSYSYTAQLRYNFMFAITALQVPLSNQLRVLAVNSVLLSASICHSRANTHEKKANT